MGDLIADAREWLATQGDRVQTHSEICHRWHPACLVARLISRSGQSEKKTGVSDADVPERDNNAAPAAISTATETRAVAAGTGDTPEANATQGECSVHGDEIERLRLAIRRLADQDATLSVQGGNVIVELDATLAAEERRAIQEAAEAYESNNEDADCERIAHTLRGLLDRTSDGGNRQ